MTRTICTLGLLAIVAGCGKDGETNDSGKKAEQRVILSHLVINEFQASNGSTLPDELGAFPDWLEIYNGTGEDIDLEGWTLTDALAVPDKWEFPAGLVIADDSYMIIFCDSDTDEGNQHASFNLDRDGGDVGLFDPGGAPVDSVSAYPVQEPDTSMSRLPNGSGAFETVNSPSPGVSND